VHDLYEIAREVRRINPEIFIIADGVQYSPHGRIDVEKWGIDGYFFSPYKTYCVKGIGMAWLSDRVARFPHWKLPAKPDDDWVIGSPGHQMYAAFSAMVDYLCWLGQKFTKSNNRQTQIDTAKEHIHSNMIALLNMILNGTDKNAGLLNMDHVVVPALGDISKRLCILPFNLKGLDARQGVKRYENEYGIRMCARVQDAYSKDILDAVGIPDAIRISACHYNSLDEINAFLAVTQNIVS
jgi:selenocysteine lyase/cysteine desulfurase